MPLAIGVEMLHICLIPLLCACSAVDFAMQHAKEWKLCAQAREEGRGGKERRTERQHGARRADDGREGNDRRRSGRRHSESDRQHRTDCTGRSLEIPVHRHCSPKSKNKTCQ